MRRPRSCGRRATGLALGVALALTGCASSTYDTERERWTRHEESYDRLASRAFIHATLKTEPFRRAYVEEYARLFDMDGEQTAAMLEVELEEAREAWVVVTSFYTPNQRANDLNPAKGFWEVRLEGEGGARARPSRVTRLKARDPAWQALYPYVHRHYTLYELHFPVQDDEGRTLASTGEALELVIAGPPARLRLRWVVP